MNKQKQVAVIFAGILLAIVIFIVIVVTAENRRAEFRIKKYEEFVGKVQFKGKVISSRTFKYGGKDYFMVCVRLDYSNTKDFYLLNEYCFLKIKNNIATMAVGFLNPDRGPLNYVEVNIDNNKIEKFHYANGVYTTGLALGSYDLTQQDINSCD